MKKAVVIFSGGQDSTTCLYWAKQNFDYVEAMTFFYGQKHSIEMYCAQTICSKEKIRQTVIDISFLNGIVESALTSDKLNINEVNKKGLPASFVPNRNALFITLAHAYAQKIGADNLVTGVCETDYSGYPDCRQMFIDAINKSLNMGSNSNIRIHTPLMFLTKEKIFKLAEDLGKIQDVVELSHTCYNGDREHRYEWGYGCDACPACELRKNGWENLFLNKFGCLNY